MKRSIHILNVTIMCMLAGLISSCGVKGDPLPPEGAPTLGRGRPTYKRGSERLNLRTEPTEDEEKSDKELGGEN